MKRKYIAVALVAGLGLGVLGFSGAGGCGRGGSGGGGSGTTDLQGTIALNDGSVGTLSVQIQSTIASKSSGFSLIRTAEAQSSTVPATGSCVSPTCTIPNLSGDYTPSTGAISISGSGSGGGCGGSTTTFVGTITPPSSSSSGGGSMSGTIQNSSGGSIGGFSGVFTPSTTGGAVSYCGIAVADFQDAFNVTVAADGSLTGSAVPLVAGSGDKGATFVGKATGSTFQACTTDNGDKAASPICGTIGADGSINGRFIRNDPGGGEGCFVGNTSVCTTGTLPAPCSGPTAVCSYPTCP